MNRQAKIRGQTAIPLLLLTIGPNITFAPDSDIAIRDGMAAVEFRSYYAGKSVIRATSPGLKDAELEITSLGKPAFIAGKTPPVRLFKTIRENLDFEAGKAEKPYSNADLIIEGGL